MKSIFCFLLILLFQTSFSDKILAHSPEPPVELASFTAQVGNGYVLLSWMTAVETNNKRFEIERSDANHDWKKVGSINGSGSSGTPRKYEFKDPLVGNVVNVYSYRLKQIDFDGNYSYSNIIEVQLVPQAAKLLGNYPNPFNPSTKIKYQVTEVGKVSLKIYNVLGKEIAELVNEKKSPGIYEVDFDASDLPSGIYFYTITANNFAEAKKMVLIK